MVMLDRIENAQPSIRVVARQQNHLHALVGGVALIERQQLLHQTKRHPLIKLKHWIGLE